MIDFCDVTRRYGTKTAVSHLELHIPAAQLFAFLGPNGAGKTTSIRMLVGLLRPSEGKVSVCGYDTVQQGREAARQVGYVPDQPFLYDKLSGREFLEFVGRLRGLPTKVLRDRIEREAARFELSGFLDEWTESYSHGMRQRVVFASAVLHDPPVLVVDEPMVGLDPKNARLAKDLLRERVAQGGAVFMSTHTLSIAEEIGDRIGIIHQGKLIFFGSVSELRLLKQGDHRSLEQIFLELTNGDQEAVSLDGKGPTVSDAALPQGPTSDRMSVAGS